MPTSRRVSPRDELRALRRVNAFQLRARVFFPPSVFTVVIFFRSPGAWARGEARTSSRFTLPQTNAQYFFLISPRRNWERRSSKESWSLATSTRPEVSRSSRWRSEEHTSELQSQSNLVCRL